MFKFTRTSPQDSLNEHFSERQKKFWRKKTPVSETYSYKVHDPFEVIGEDTLGFEKLYLVGDNWKECPEKPVAIIIGCNDWKYGFIADYLKEYRCAFGSRKLVGLNMVKILLTLKFKPDVTVIWGYTETRLLESFIKYKKIPLWRIEDGFIRSADLGASHSIPYSLVIDKKGLYYNSHKPSEIEDLLNTYDFDKESDDYKQYSDILETINSHKISKYNPPILAHATPLKVKNRILIIGQVDNDASLRYGNPNNWTMEDMVRLAYYENPNAEILYRPHPEVYKGYQKSKFKKQNIEKFAKVISSEEHIVELIERIDHVYTLTSLTGLEALLRGKKVTVLGMPFYAGWGLTDDRCSCSRRQRTLTIEQLFFATYIIYPKYFAESIGANNKKEAILSTILKIRGDRLENFHLVDNFTSDSDLIANINFKISSYFKNPSKLSTVQIREVFTFFQKYNINDYLLSLFYGLLETNDQKVDFITSISNLVKTDEYFDFIKKKSHEFSIDEFNTLISKLLVTSSTNFDINELQNFFNDVKDGLRKNTQENKIPTSINNKNSLIKLMQDELSVHIANEKSNEALLLIKGLLENPNQSVVNLLNQASTLLNDTFQFNQATGLSILSMMIDFKKNNRKGLLNYIEAKYLLSECNIDDEVLDYIFLSIKTNPELISKYRSMIGRNNQVFSLLTITTLMNKEKTISKMMGYIENGFYNEAQKLFFELYDNPNIKKDKLIKVYTDFLHAEGKTRQALEILLEFRKIDNSPFILRQQMRFYQFIGNFNLAEEVYFECLSLGLDLNPTLYLPILLNKKQYKLAYEKYISENFSKKLNILLGDKYRRAHITDDITYENKSMIIAVYGPGDEIRFSSIYNDLSLKLQNKVFSITCDERLCSIFERSFPNIDFIPVARTRGITPQYPVENYNRLPSLKLSSILDNQAYESIEKYQHIFLVTDYIPKLRNSQSDFGGGSYLQADQTKIHTFIDLLSPYSNDVLVGLNWRSSLTNFSRMEHYLEIQQLAPLFKIPNVKFINLQYDDCSKELEWVYKNYPNKLINFEDIDQYNDFDSVAALISCMDLVIAPATTVAELSGALGKSTWLFSNSSEIDWRKIDNEGTDIWHNSIKIVDVQEKGNKELLVEKIYNDLVAFSETHQKNCKRQIS